MTIRETIAELIERRKAKAFLIDANTGSEISYGAFHVMACSLAAELSRRGLSKGDRIAVMAPNCCELVAFYFACIYLGAVIVPINPLLNRSEVEFIVTNSGSKTIVTSESCANSVRGLGVDVIRLSAAQDPIGLLSADVLRIDALECSTDLIALESATAEDLIAIMYTSGTSAKPKGVVHRLGGMFHNAQVFAGAQGIDEDSRFYHTLSMSYMGGFYNLLILPFLCGASVVVDHVFDARSSLHFWDKAKNNKANTLWLAPTVLSILLRMDRGRTGEEFCRNSVRHAFVGFAPLPLKVKDEFETRYGARLIENYGLSETLFVTARSQDSINAQGYVGETLPGVRIRLVNGEHESAGLDAEGEVEVLTEDLMAGYLNSAGALMEVDSTRWFATGDVGRLGENGSLVITGRKKDLIIRGGVNISPAAIEEALMHVSGVIEVAVVSVPHELYGEDIVAVLKLAPGIQLESLLDTLVAHAKHNLAQHQQPARYITIDEFPRTANGKVQKSRIRELLFEKLQLRSLAGARTRTAEPAGVAS